MPKIRINEIDKTGSLNLAATTNVVYFPAKVKKDNTEQVIARKLFESAPDFKKFYEDNTYEKDLNYKVVYHLLSLGFSVLFEGIASTTVEVFVGKTKPVTPVGSYWCSEDGGDYTQVTTVAFNGEETYYVYDGSEYTEASLSGAFGTDTYYTSDGSEYTRIYSGNEEACVYATKEQTTSWEISDEVWAALEDKSLYDLRFLTTGLAACPSTRMLLAAANRGDAIALLDHPETTDSVAAIRTYFENLKLSDNEKNSYGAAFVPWFRTKDSELLVGTDTFEKLPASLGYLFAYGRSVAVNPEWLAVAGSARGVIPELFDVVQEFTSAEIEILQSRSKTVEVALDAPTDNIGIAINPIAKINPFGYIIWGNRTFFENKDEDGVEGGDLKAISFLNVRNLVSSVKKALYKAARKYTFEQNSDLLWVNFTSQVIPMLDKMQSGNGILGYKFIKIKTTKKARLCAQLTIVPIEAVEDFDIDIILTDSIEVSE